MKWIEKYKINAHDADYNGIVSASGLLRYIQDAANSHMKGEDPSYDELFDRGYAFILTRLHMVSHAPVYRHENIEVETWETGHRGLSSNRCYTLSRDGRVLVEAASVWAIVGVNDKKLYRADEIGVSYASDEELPLMSDMRFRMPKDDEMAHVGERTVAYEYVDRNGHMNNTYYADILCGFIPDMRGVRVSDLMINFRSEAPLGETLRVTMKQDGDVYYFRTLRTDGSVNIDARVTLTRI